MNYKRLLIVFFISIIFTIFIGINLFITTSESIPYFFSYLSNTLIFSFIFFLSFSFKKSLMMFSIIITFLISTIAIYYSAKYQIRINFLTVGATLQTNLEEAGNLINYEIILYITLSILLSIFLSYIFCKYDVKNSVNNKLSFVSICFVASVIFFGGFEICEDYLPYNYLHGIYKFFELKDLKVNLQEDFPSLYMDPKNSQVNVIVILGESARYDHFHLNGYAKPTSPNLDKRTNLVSYEKVYSCDNFTYRALPCLISLNKKQYDRNQNDYGPNILTLFNHLGFRTSWIATQGTNSIFEENINNIASFAHKKFLVHYEINNENIFDDHIFPYLQKILAVPSPQNFILIHTRGSHYDYEDRYRENFRLFSPTCPKTFLSTKIKKCSTSNLINSYDNTILYTDYFINEVIKKVENTNSIIFYFSDHGESLGEDGFFLHGNALNEQQLHIPFFIWMSDSYKQNFPKKWHSLKANRTKNYDYRNFFHSILHCSGATSEIIDPRLSICN